MKVLLKIRPLLIGLSLFSLAWMIVLEARLSSDERFGPSLKGLYFDQIFLAALLVLASVALLLRKLKGIVAAAVLSSGVLLNVLCRDFLLLAKAAEVPRFTYRHFSLWWPNLGEGQLFQIILASTILAYAVTSLFQRRKGAYVPYDV